jgi:four helix bundle protein
VAKEEEKKRRREEEKKRRNRVAGKITNHRELDVYKKAMEAAMQVFRESRAFPKEETYSLTDQVRRSSRSVCANLAEAWRRRRYEAAFVANLNECEAEAAETQTWLEFAVRCDYLEAERGKELYQVYNEILAMLSAMIQNPSPWLLLLATRPAKET